MKRFDQINVIPFIDIMLVLLAIVLTTASFISQGVIELELPEAESAQAAEDKPSVKLSVSADGEFYLDEEKYEKEALGKALAELPKTTEFTLRVDKAVRFEHFMTVVDLLKIHELERLTIMTESVQ